MSKVFKATPLFDAHKAFVRLPMGMAMFNDYPDSKAFIESLCITIPDVRDDVMHTPVSYTHLTLPTKRIV